MEQLKPEFNKESLIKLVKDYYSVVYKRYKEKKTCEYRLPSNVDFDALKELAITDKIPEAIFSFAIYKEGREILQGVFSNDIVDLFGDFSIRDIALLPEISLKMLRSKTNKTNNVTTYFERWKEKRRTIIFGSHYPYYEDEKAFDRIINQILPIATKDIWEDIYEYFTDTNEYILSEHAEKIKELYKQFKQVDKGSESNNTKSSKSKSVWSTIKIDFALAKNDIDSILVKNNFEKIECLVSELKKVKTPRELYACIVYLLCDYDKKMNVEKATKFVFDVDVQLISAVYESLNDVQKSRFINDYIKPANSKNEFWKYAVVQSFIRLTLKDCNINMVISNIGDLSECIEQTAFEMLVDELDFWKSLSEIKLGNVFNDLWKVLPREKFYTLAFLIIKWQKKENNSAPYIFVKSIVAKWISDDVSFDEIDKYYEKLNKYALDNDIDICKLSFDYSKNKLKLLNGQIASLNELDSGRATVEKFMTALSAYEEIEWLLAMLLDDDSKDLDFAKNKLKSSIEKFRQELEHCGIYSSVDFDRFLSRTPELFSFDKYSATVGNIDDGAKIRIMSMGLKNEEYAIEKLPKAKKIIVRKNKE